MGQIHKRPHKAFTKVCQLGDEMIFLDSHAWKVAGQTLFSTAQSIRDWPDQASQSEGYALAI